MGISACIVAPLVAFLGGHVQPTTQDAGPMLAPSPLSIERIGDGIRKAPALTIDLDVVRLPVATFRTRVEGIYLPSFKEQLEHEFRLSPLQRRARELASRCCGINLIELVDRLDKWSKKRETQRIRMDIERELAQIKAAAKK